MTFLAAHALVTLGRGDRGVGKAVDHRVRVLLDHGRLRADQLRYVPYETKGEPTVVRETADHPDGSLVEAGLDDATGFTLRPAHPDPAPGSR